MPTIDDNSDVRRAVRWLRRIGLQVEKGTRFAQPFNAGLWIENGVLVFDPEQAHAGDLLHEAGHLAVLPSVIRRYANADVDESVRDYITEYMEANPGAFTSIREDRVARACMQSGDAEVIAWAYAAALEARLDPWLTCVNGFGNGDDGENTFLALSHGAYLGINGLRTAGFMDRLNEFPKLKFWVQP
jgi:hypothetical protein